MIINTPLGNESAYGQHPSANLVINILQERKSASVKLTAVDLIINSQAADAVVLGNVPVDAQLGMFILIESASVILKSAYVDVAKNSLAD